MDEREGNPTCKHEWVYDNKVIATYPPIYHKICKKCGCLKHESPKYERRESFDEINARFVK